jgi:four helix bundle protein
MSDIRSFKELKVWKKAMDLAMEIFEVTKGFPMEERYSLTDQIRRSSRSVPTNIAEAWRKRRYPAAFVSKLNDAEGESAETQTHLEIAKRCGYIDSASVSRFDDSYEEIMAMLVSMVARPEQWAIRPSKNSKGENRV